MPLNRNQIAWAQKLRQTLPVIAGKRTLDSWGFGDFLKFDLERCGSCRGVASKLFCDFMDNEAAQSSVEEIYGALMEFLGHPHVSTEARRLLMHLVNSPFHGRVDYERWFNDNIPSD